MALSLVLILIAGINFSLLIPVNKIAGDAGFPNFAYVFWYALGAGLILLVPAVILRELPRITWPAPQALFRQRRTRFRLPLCAARLCRDQAALRRHRAAAYADTGLHLCLAVLFRLDRFRLISAAGLLTAIAGSS